MSLLLALPETLLLCVAEGLHLRELNALIRTCRGCHELLNLEALWQDYYSVHSSIPCVGHASFSPSASQISPKQRSALDDASPPSESCTVPSRFWQLSVRRRSLSSSWIRGHYQAPKFFLKHPDVVTCLSFDQTNLVSGSLDHAVRIFSMNDGQLLGTIADHDSPISSVDFNGSFILSGAMTRGIQLHSWDSFHRLRQIRGHSSRITFVKATAGSTFFSSALDATFKVWDAERGVCVKTYFGQLSSMAFPEPHNCNIIVGGLLTHTLRFESDVPSSGGIGLWDLRSPRGLVCSFPLEESFGVRCVAVCDALCVGGSDSGLVYALEMRSNRAPPSFDHCVTYCPSKAPTFFPTPSSRFFSPPAAVAATGNVSSPLASFPSSESKASNDFLPPVTHIALSSSRLMCLDSTCLFSAAISPASIRYRRADYPWISHSARAAGLDDFQIRVPFIDGLSSTGVCAVGRDWILSRSRNLESPTCFQHDFSSETTAVAVKNCILVRQSDWRDPPPTQDPSLMSREELKAEDFVPIKVANPDGGNKKPQKDPKSFTKGKERKKRAVKAKAALARSQSKRSSPS